MPWVRLDDHWGSHPKVLSAGLDGMGLYCWGLTYCALQTTDGFIPRAALPEQLKGTRPAAEVLVRVGLWEQAPGGWTVHDYAAYQPTRAQVEADRAQRAEAGRAGAHARWHTNGMRTA